MAFHWQRNLLLFIVLTLLVNLSKAQDDPPNGSEEEEEDDSSSEETVEDSNESQRRRRRRRRLAESSDEGEKIAQNISKNSRTIPGLPNLEDITKIAEILTTVGQQILPALVSGDSGIDEWNELNTNDVSITKQVKKPTFLTDTGCMVFLSKTVEIFTRHSQITNDISLKLSTFVLWNILLKRIVYSRTNNVFSFVQISNGEEIGKEGTYQYMVTGMFYEAVKLYGVIFGPKFLSLGTKNKTNRLRTDRQALIDSNCDFHSIGTMKAGDHGDHGPPLNTLNHPTVAHITIFQNRALNGKWSNK
ncbi:os-C isoform 1-T1 [Glossina fuscipes fuscipes]